MSPPQLHGVPSSMLGSPTYTHQLSLHTHTLMVTCHTPTRIALYTHNLCAHMQSHTYTHIRCLHTQHTPTCSHSLPFQCLTRVHSHSPSHNHTPMSTHFAFCLPLHTHAHTQPLTGSHTLIRTHTHCLAHALAHPHTRAHALRSPCSQAARLTGREGREQCWV